MTGSGAARGPTELGELRVEIRTVNGRNLAIKSRLPTECQGIEPRIDAMVRARLRRGTVMVAMDLSKLASAAETAVDTEVFARVVEQLSKLASDSGLRADVSISDVLKVPGVLRASGGQRVRTSFEPSAEVIALLTEALDGLLASRAEEGAATLAAVRSHLAGLQGHLTRIGAHAPRMLAQHRSKLLQRVNEFLASNARQLDDQDVIRELTLFADRVDISEELQRMESHLLRFANELDRGGEVGRGLEFLLQEMLRETNTIGSKSPDVEIAHAVVDIKSEIDKLKEQVANLE